MRRIGSALAVAWALAAAAACATTLPPATPETAPGRALYTAKCHACHRMYRPDRVGPEKWPALLEKMAEKAKLTPEEEKQVLDYVLAVSPPGPPK